MEHEFFIPLLLIPCSLAAGKCLQEGLQKVFGVKIAPLKIEIHRLLSSNTAITKVIVILIHAYIFSSIFNILTTIKVQHFILSS